MPMWMYVDVHVISASVRTALRTVHMHSRGGGSLGAHMQVAQHNSKESCWVALHGAVRCAACAIDIARPKPQRHRNSMHMLEQLCVHLQSRGYPLSRTSPARPFSARAARAQATGA